MNSRNLKILGSSFATALSLLLSPATSSAEVFCIHTSDELQNALSKAAANKENDMLKIVQGIELDDFHIPREAGHSLKIESGYSAACTERELAPKISAETISTAERMQPDASPQQSTTGPVPPPPVEAKKAMFSAAALSGGADVTVLGVPAYAWRHGCGPTAVGMIAGYWDSKGCPDLFDDSAATQTSAVDQGIASQGSAAAPRHYEDYSLPEDASDVNSSPLPDKSEYPAGDEHANDSIADFMRTSWSGAENYYGWSWSSDIIPAFTDYALFRNSTYSTTAASYSYGSSLTWDILTQEIDAQRPMVFLVDSDGDGNTDHFVTVAGYRLDGDVQYYGCLDTWDPVDEIRWEKFRGMSSDYAWGVWGGFSFQPSCGTSMPDLVVTSLKVTSFSPDSIQYAYTIKNIGTGPANLDGPTAEDSDNVSVQAYLSTDTVFNNTGDIPAGGTILGASPLGNLAPGETFSGSFGASATVDPSATPYLVLQVDWGSVVDESNEDNNTRAVKIAPKMVLPAALLLLSD
jgi:hypothetical protein